MITSVHAAITINQGLVVAYPTESFYAFGADATNPKAIRKLFKLKKREPTKPIALIAADFAQVKKFFYVSAEEMKIAKKYWPGPLTLLLQPKVPAGKTMVENDERYISTRALGIVPTPMIAPDRGVVGGLIDSFSSGSLPRLVLVGVRVPGHAGARRLAKLAGVPLTATSANLSGGRPTKSETGLKRNFLSLPIMIGQCGKQQRPSTIIELIDHDIRVHRAGATKMS